MTAFLTVSFVAEIKYCITTHQWVSPDLEMERERETGREREIERDIDVIVIVSMMRLLFNCMILLYVLCCSISTILKCAKSNTPYFEVPFKQNKKIIINHQSRSKNRQ